MKIFKYIGAWAQQVGGKHYKQQGHIQPFHFSMANGHNNLQSSAIKYIDRYKDKNGVEDIKKAINVLSQLIAWEEEEVIEQVGNSEQLPISVSCFDCRYNHTDCELCKSCGLDYRNFTPKS